MRLLKCIILFFALTAVPIPQIFAQNDRRLHVSSRDQNPEKRIALVIGNATYKNSPLHNPLNDAKDMTVVLREKKFHVIVLLDADRRQMIDAVRKFGQELKKGGVGLFYYAGHGMQVEGRNYLIPINANIEIENEVPLEAVDVNRILGFMDAAENHLNIVILDACRDNPFARSFRSFTQGLAQMDAPTGTLIAYATSPGKTAADGTDDNGIYTKHVLEQMKVPGLEVGQMFRLVRKGVRIETGSKQIPWESTSLEGNFYFSGGATSQPVFVPTVATRKEEPSEHLYKIVNTVQSTGITIPHSLKMDISRCQITFEQGGGEWEVVKLMTKSCDPIRRFIFRSLSRNGYWVDSDWQFSTGTVIRGKWRDSMSNYGAVVGTKSGTDVCTFVHTFKNKAALTAGSLLMDTEKCKIVKGIRPPDNEWRIVKIVTKSCDPGRHIVFRTLHENGYHIDYDWTLSNEITITGTWFDSNGDTGTTIGARE